MFSSLEPFTVEQKTRIPTRKPYPGPACPRMAEEQWGCSSGAWQLRTRNIKYNLKDFGDLVNTVSPVHIKQGSALQEILSRFVNMDGEKEDLTAYGDTLMRAGIALKPAFAGTGYNSDTRLFPDFSSRIYFMEAAE